LLAAYRDILFRELGSCIHSFLQINPNSVTAGPAGKTIALENAFVFPLDEVDDPRTPAAPVPASIKWLNDELDRIVNLGDRYPGAPLAPQAEIVHRQCVLELRRISPQAANYAVKLAATESNAKTPDDWDRTEADAVEHVVHTLDIIGLGFPHPTVGAENAHATVIINNQAVDLLAIRANTHEACVQHAKVSLPLSRRQVLLVSRDCDNTHWRRKLGSFLQPIAPRLGEERNITDPTGGLLHLGYHNLLDAFRNSASAPALEGAINVELTA
jgi:hypothetical protein